MDAPFRVLLPPNTQQLLREERSRVLARRRMRQGVGLVGWMALCAGAAAIGALATRDAPEFYAQLTLPVWAPPASWFGPVWTILYGMMAFAAWEVWRRGVSGEVDRATVRPALALFTIQLAVNALWSWVFFAWHRGAWSVAVIVALLVLVILTARRFLRIHAPSGLLLVPYIVWLGYAGTLALAAWRNNPVLLAGQGR